MSAAGMCPTIRRTDEQGLMRVRCEIDGAGRDCRILELDSRRAFIESFVPAITGSRVRMQFRLPSGHQVCATGIVSSHEFKVGFGVDFTGLSLNDREQLTKLIG
jgi:hypothetical protein